MDKKRDLTPVGMVAREISDDCGLPEEEVEDAIRRVLTLLMDRAESAIASDHMSPGSLSLSHEYLVISELVLSFGTALKALEDIDGSPWSGRQDSLS